MIALGIVTHPKTFEFWRNLVRSLPEAEHCPPIYAVAGSIDDYTVPQVQEIRSFCRLTDGELFAADTVTWEIGAIDILNKRLPREFEEFVFLQDTFEFKEGMFPTFWKRMNDFEGETLWFTNNFQMYAGKFRREVLRKMPNRPWPRNKHEAVAGEGNWSKSYNDHEEPWLIRVWSFIPDGVEEFEKCGRMNVRCENDYFVKWKGTHTGNLHRRLQEIDEEGKL